MGYMCVNHFLCKDMKQRMIPYFNEYQSRGRYARNNHRDLYAMEEHEEILDDDVVDLNDDDTIWGDDDDDESKGWY